jgi:hypothetical protein
MSALTSGRVAAATSVLALVVALSGTGYAAVKIKGNQIAKNAITSKTVKNDSLTGKDVKESTLATVPSAQSAASAATAADAAKVSGFGITKVYYRGNDDRPAVVFNGGGLVITANCESGNLSLVATTTKQDSSFFSHLVDVENDAILGALSEGGNFDPGTSVSLLGGANQSQYDPAIITLEYEAPDHSVATGTLSTDYNPFGGDNHCGVTGTVTQG